MAVLKLGDVSVDMGRRIAHRQMARSSLTPLNTAFWKNPLARNQTHRDPQRIAEGCLGTRRDDSRRCGFTSVAYAQTRGAAQSAPSTFLTDWAWLPTRSLSRNPLLFLGFFF